MCPCGHPCKYMINLISEKLSEVGYIASPELSAQIALLLSSGKEGIRSMVLDGPPGVGKTFLAKSVAKILGVDYVYIQAHPGSSPEDFLFDTNIVSILKSISGDKEAVQETEDVIELGFLPRIFKMSQKGLVVAFVDEIDKASPKVDSLFLSALQEGEVIVKGLGSIKAVPENLLLFFTKNDERELSEPLMRRLRREYLGYPAPELEIALLTGAIGVGEVKETFVIQENPVTPEKEVVEVLVHIANLLRQKQENLIKPPATQELAMAAKDITRLAGWGEMAVAGHVAYNWLAGFLEDQQVLKEIISKKELGKLLVEAVDAASTRLEIAKGSLSIPNDEFVSFGK